MNIIDAIQGTELWLSIRAKHYTASEAPAMMGASKYQTRTELLRQKHTGLAADVDDSTQRLFDRGHAAEAAARPIAEEIIGDELFPATGALEVDGLPLLASFDGVTMLEDICWENKLWNAALADAVRAEQLAPHYYWQLEQQLLVSGAEKVYFTTSDGTPENTVGMWYESLPERRAALIAGWKQFAEDLANYQHVEQTVAPVAASIEALPALFVQVEGKVLATNLDAFKASAQTFIDNIKTELVNDQDFADADKMVKFLKDGEDRLAQAKQHALAQTASIDELFRTVDAISEQMRSKRLALDKLVKAEKVNRKAEIISKARAELQAHIAKLNERIGGVWVTYPVDAQFAAVTAGLKSLDSMRDKVSGALANAKIEANEIADRIEFNAKQITVDGANYNYLVHDFAQICTKPTEDFAAIMAQRVAAHKAAEAEKIEAAKKAEEDRIAAAVEAERKAGEARAAAEVERIRKEEAEKAALEKKREEARAYSEQQLEKSPFGSGVAPQGAAPGGPGESSTPAPAAITPPTPEAQRAVLVEAGDDVRAYLNTLDVSDKEFGRLRAVLMGYEQFKSARALQAAA